MAIGVDSVTYINSEFAAQAESSPYFDRGRNDRVNKNTRNRILRILSPERAIDLNTTLEKFNSFSFDFKEPVSLINNVRELLPSIEAADEPAAVEIMAPLLDNLNLAVERTPDRTVVEEVKRALGFYALRQSLLIATAHPDKVERVGPVKDYLDITDSAKQAQAAIEELAQKLPILTQPAVEVMNINNKWLRQDETLAKMKTAETELGLFLPSYLKLIPILKKGADYSAHWTIEGLDSSGIPVASLSLDQVLVLARFYAWAELAEDTPEEEREIAFESWKHDKEKLMSLTTHLSIDEKSKARTELATIENALFEPV